jgi:methanogen homoisocitrate dehydrogenase
MQYHETRSNRRRWIGREVIPAAVEVLDAFGLELEKSASGTRLCKVGRTGTAMSEEDLDTIKSCDAVLFGRLQQFPDPVIKACSLPSGKNLTSMPMSVL